MTDPDPAADLIASLDRSEARLGALASTAPLPGLTDPDPDGEERWDAGQVWAHIAELIPYWTGQARLVVAGRGPEPVAVGRTKTAASRVDGIQAGRHRTAAEQWQAIRAALDELRRFVRGLSAEEWQAQGVLPTGVSGSVSFLLTRVVANHLGEHAAQLERLAGR